MLLDYSFFRRYCLHILSHIYGVSHHQMIFNETNEELLTHLLDVVPEEKRHDVETMFEIEYFWQAEDGCSYIDKWFEERYAEFLYALFSMPTDEVTDMFPLLDFNGKKLAYYSSGFQGMTNKLYLRSADAVMVTATEPELSCHDLCVEDLSFDFAPKQIWDVILLLMATQWMWSQEMYIVSPIEEDGREMIPRVTMYGDKALATFYTANGKMNDAEQDLLPVYKNGVLVQRQGQSFEIIGGYSVYDGEGYNFENILDDPLVIPPPHQLTDAERANKEDISKRERARWHAYVAAQNANTKNVDPRFKNLPF